MPPALRPRTRAPVEGARGLRSPFPGPPFRLPGVADRVAEGWWRLAPRARTVIVGLGGLALLAGTLLRVGLSPYGPPVPVLVATVDLPVGAVPGPSTIATQRWPRSLVPPAPLATRDDLVDARLTMGVTAGTVLTRRHVRDDGPLADLVTGGAAVPVPADLLRGARAGATLDLVTVVGDGSGRTIAQDVRVLAVTDGTVWLEVARDRVADVAAAALRGTLSGAVLAD